jgi:predicted ATPase
VDLWSLWDKTLYKPGLVDDMVQSFALRGVLSLRRRWQQQAKQTEARALLAPIDAWFTEGFDTAALQKAKALLETLAG